MIHRFEMKKIKTSNLPTCFAMIGENIMKIVNVWILQDKQKLQMIVYP